MHKEVGGQAVIDGVMMRCRNKVAIAVRTRKGIITEKIRFKSLTEKHKALKFPFMRGVIMLFEMMVLGFKALMRSADISAGDEGIEISSWQMALTLGFSILAGVALFILAPLFLTRLVFSGEGVIFNLIDGVIRAVIVIGYIAAISMMRDIREMFRYHGAEHKAVHCYEANEELTVKNVKKHSTLHPRCGTAFIMIVLVISIFVFSLITSPAWYFKLMGRLILLPVIAGISYEILKLGGKYRENMIMKMAVFPGLMMQKITTGEPSPKQIETAIVAIKKVI